MKFLNIPKQTHCYVSGIKLQFAQCLELMYVLKPSNWNLCQTKGNT